MNNISSDNEIHAVQGLLALRNSSTRGGNNKSNNTDLLYWNLPLSPQPSSNGSRVSPIAYNSPISYENNGSLVLGMSSMTTRDNSTPTPQPSPRNSSVLYYEPRFAKQTQEQVSQFKEFQQQAHLSHQAQLVRQSQEPHYTTQQQRTVLPSINEMMAHPHHPLLSRNSPTRTAVPPYHPYHNSKRQHAISSSVDRIEKHHSLEARRQRIEQQQQQRQLAEMLHHSHQLELKMLLQSQQNHRLLASLQNRTEAELQSFFQSLRQFYREEYEKELKQQRQEQQEETTTTEEEEEEEDEDNEDSDYQPTTRDNCAVASSLINANKKTNNNTKTKASGTDKPRWTAEEKSELFEAIVRHKSLDIMSTFDWALIGQDVGRLDKACKDQWRRGILKMFKEFILNSSN
jgi:hypothetical protein